MPEAFRVPQAAEIAEPMPASTYCVYGLRVASEVALPHAPVIPTDGVPDVTIRLRAGQAPAPAGSQVAWMPCEVHGADMRVYRGAGSAWIWQREAATFCVHPAQGAVDVYPEHPAHEAAIAYALVGPVLLFLLHKRGTPPLHASAVVTGKGAIIFLGAQGQGKSTMSAAFLTRGATVLTDDALPLRLAGGEVQGIPGPPYMKVWRETAQHTLGMTAELPEFLANFTKKLLALDDQRALASAPTRIGAVYLLARYDPASEGRTDIASTSLNGHESLAALLTHTSNRAYLLPAEEALLLPVYAALARQAPVRRLSYPSGFEHQEAVHARVLADLEAQ